MKVAICLLLVAGCCLFLCCGKSQRVTSGPPPAPTVCIQEGDSTYHRIGCELLKGKRSTYSEAEVQRSGYSPCASCLPLDALRGKNTASIQAVSGPPPAPSVFVQEGDGYYHRAGCALLQGKQTSWPEADVCKGGYKPCWECFLTNTYLDTPAYAVKAVEEQREISNAAAKLGISNDDYIFLTSLCKKYRLEIPAAAFIFSECQRLARSDHDAVRLMADLASQLTTLGAAPLDAVRVFQFVFDHDLNPREIAVRVQFLKEKGVLSWEQLGWYASLSSQSASDPNDALHRLSEYAGVDDGGAPLVHIPPRPSAPSALEAEAAEQLRVQAEIAQQQRLQYEQEVQESRRLQQNASIDAQRKANRRTTSEAVKGRTLTSQDAYEGARQQPPLNFSRDDSDQTMT